MRAEYARRMDSDDESDSSGLLTGKSRLFRAFIAALFASEAVCFILAVSATLSAKSFGLSGWPAIVAGLTAGYYGDYCFDILWAFFARRHYQQVGWRSLCRDSLFFLATDKVASWTIVGLEAAISAALFTRINSELAVVCATLIVQFPIYCAIFTWLSVKAMPCLISVESRS